MLGDLPFVEPDPTQEEDQKILDKKRTYHRDKRRLFKRPHENYNRVNSQLYIYSHCLQSRKNISGNLPLGEKELPNENVKLLHSQFNQEDRNQIEKEIAGGLPPKVLIATQVVEVSLDMDFELGFFEPAPIDALVQRMGRVNRYGNRPPAKITTFTKMVNPHSVYCNCQNQLHKDNCR